MWKWRYRVTLTYIYGWINCSFIINNWALFLPGIYFLVETVMTSPRCWGQIFGITSLSGICSHADVPKEVGNISYGCKDCPAEIVDPNWLQDFTLGQENCYSGNSPKLCFQKYKRVAKTLHLVFCLGTGVPRHRDGAVRPYVRTYVRTSLAYRVQYFSTS